MLERHGVAHQCGCGGQWGVLEDTLDVAPFEVYGYRALGLDHRVLHHRGAKKVVSRETPCCHLTRRSQTTEPISLGIKGSGFKTQTHVHTLLHSAVLWCTQGSPLTVAGRCILVCVRFRSSNVIKDVLPMAGPADQN